MQPLSKINGLLACAILIAVCPGCFYESHSGSYARGSRNVGAREIRYELDGGGQVSTSGDPPVTTVDFVQGTVAIEQSRVLIDGQEVMQLPPTAKSVLVKFAAGRISIAVDGRETYAAQLADADEPTGTFSD